ncbi:MAG: riboflavin synthase [Armatimonadaceae bacterium]|jgi:riboflavin synthase
MFTGIVETTGRVTRIDRLSESVRLSIAAGRVSEDVALGDSIAVNGVCLTVVSIDAPELVFDAVYETLRRTTLGSLAVGDVVNLERAMIANGRFGGHIVQGHVDGVGRIASMRPVGNAWQVHVDVDSNLMRYIVEKGSICIDGISLTVADAGRSSFSVSVIPHTWDNTTLSARRAGDALNIECDIIGKYVERLMGFSTSTNTTSSVSMDMLVRTGFATEAATDTW